MGCNNSQEEPEIIVLSPEELVATLKKDPEATKKVYLSTWWEGILSSQIFRNFPFKSKHPLSFLSSRLSQFTKATRIFTTRDYTHTNVAAEFHQACDNIPNTLVIIKSGQYIAGGYTEVAWSSPPYTKPSAKAFVFSANNQKLFVSLGKGKEVWCDSRDGPAFNDGDGFALKVAGDYKTAENASKIKGGKYSAEGVVDAEKELFGKTNFVIDEYEVYKLE